MSTLCSIDLAKALPQWGFRLAPSALPAPAADHPLISLSCYTFGAPRTGNTAFAQDFNRHVPDCWAVINGQDAVAHAGKFFFLFKRPGKPVLLSRSGDLIVRPSAIEHTAHRHAVGASPGWPGWRAAGSARGAFAFAHPS